MKIKIHERRSDDTEWVAHLLSFGGMETPSLQTVIQPRHYLWVMLGGGGAPELNNN